MDLKSKHLTDDIAYTPAFRIAEADVDKLAAKFTIPITQTEATQEHGFIPISPFLTNKLILVSTVDACHIVSCQMLDFLKDKVSTKDLYILNQALPGITLLAIMPMVPVFADTATTAKIEQFFKRVKLSSKLYPSIQPVNNDMFSLTLNKRQQKSMGEFVLNLAKSHPQ